MCKEERGAAADHGQERQDCGEEDEAAVTAADGIEWVLSHLVIALFSSAWSCLWRDWHSHLTSYGFA